MRSGIPSSSTTDADDIPAFIFRRAISTCSKRYGLPFPSLALLSHLSVSNIRVVPFPVDQKQQMDITKSAISTSITAIVLARSGLRELAIFTASPFTKNPETRKPPIGLYDSDLSSLATTTTSQACTL